MYYEEPVNRVDLCVCKLPKDLFFYGRRFDAEDLASVSIEEQIADQLDTADDPDKKLIVSGRLLVKKNENEDELIMLKSGISSVPLDISALENFYYFHGMMVKLSCLPTSSTQLKAVCYLKPKLLPSLPLRGIHDSLRVIVAHGPFTENNGVNLLELLAEKALLIKAHAMILCGPFYDSKDTAKLTADSKKTFTLLCSKLKNSHIKIIVVPNATHDQLTMQVFPTPSQTLLDFGLSDEADKLSNVTFVTDPCIFDLNGVRFAVTTSQALFLLSKLEKYQGSTQGGDRMSRLCEHIFMQRSLCPVQRIETSGVIHEALRAHLTERPHFVIAPSNLAPMVKHVQNSVFINSRYCNKNALRYATISVNLREARQATGDVNIADYSNVEILNEPIQGN